jgi:hypothetical protein
LSSKVRSTGIWKIACSSRRLAGISEVLSVTIANGKGSSLMMKTAELEIRPAVYSLIMI